MNGSDSQELKPLVGAGATSMSLDVRDKRVVINFPSAVSWAAFEPQVALQMAHQLIAAVEDCGLHVTMEVPPPKTAPRVRERMVARAKMILNSKRARPESNEVLATRIVDMVLNLMEV
jgi:hypothetical protein